MLGKKVGNDGYDGTRRFSKGWIRSGRVSIFGWHSCVVISLSLYLSGHSRGFFFMVATRTDRIWMEMADWNRGRREIYTTPMFL